MVGEMNQRCRDLVGLGEALFSKRQPLECLWQAIADNFHVMRADFTRKRFFSEEFASHLMTGRPALAHRDLSNSIGALMRPVDRQWVWGRTHDTRINENSTARAYLDWMSETMFRAMYDPRAALVRSCSEADGDWSAFGNAVLSVEPNEWRDGLLIRDWHLRDVVWTESTSLQVNQVHHKREISVRDLYRMFPTTVPSKLALCREKEPDREIKCRRVVVPSDEYDAVVKNKARFPFVLIDIDVENDVILAEVPLRSQRYVIPRWATIAGSQYAYSPATIYGLPDARMLQQITLTMLDAGQKATDPPMIAVTEAIAGGVNSGAGMITWTDADYDERTGEVLRPMEMRFDGIRYGAEREERVEGTLDATFFLNQLRMPQVTKDMTAFEASKLYEEFQRNALPLLEPVRVEYNGGLCSACYEVLQELVSPATGLPFFGSPFDMPQILRAQEIRWEFDTPLKAAAEQAKVFTFAQVTDTLAKGMQIDPTVRLNVDMDKATRAAVTGGGGAEWLVDEQVVAQQKAQQAQQAAAAQQSAAMAQHADTATKVGTAVKSAADASSALQGSGAM